MLIILISGLHYISANVDLVCGQRALEKISYKCECMSQYYGNPHENCGECRAGYFKFPTCSSMYFFQKNHFLKTISRCSNSNMQRNSY